jgi:hypothetical protein
VRPTSKLPGGFVDLPSQTTAIDSQFLNDVEQALLALLGGSWQRRAAGLNASLGRFVHAGHERRADPAAAIPLSKIDFGPGLTNAYIAAGAAIAY